MFVFGFIFAGTSFASEKSPDLGKLDAAKVKITVTNDQTGETTVINSKAIKNIKSKKAYSILSDNDSVDVGYDVFIPIETETETPNSPSMITPLDDSGGTKTSGGVTARLNVNYNLRKSSTNQEIKVNTVSGSWTPSSSMYYLSTRTVDAHSGAIHGSSLSKKPTSNSFSYSTGWGYNVYATGQASPRAWTSAKVHISGMTSTHTINLEITYP